MRRIHQVKTENRYSSGQVFENKLTAKVRLNLNDLLKKRQDAKNSDKKTNLLIVCVAAAVAVVVLAILSL